MKDKLRSSLMSNVFRVSPKMKIQCDYGLSKSNMTYLEYLASSIITSEYIKDDKILFISPSDDVCNEYLRSIEAAKKSLYALRVSISRLDRENND